MFFLLAFGLAALAFAVRFATAPTQRSLRTALGLSAATACTAVTGICTAFSVVGHQAPDYLKRHPDTSLAEVALLGFAESMSPGILGFTLLSLVGLILALGLYRQSPA